MSLGLFTELEPMYLQRLSHSTCSPTHHSQASRLLKSMYMHKLTLARTHANTHPYIKHPHVLADCLVPYILECKVEIIKCIVVLFRYSIVSFTRAERAVLFLLSDLRQRSLVDGCDLKFVLRLWKYFSKIQFKEWALIFYHRRKVFYILKQIYCNYSNYFKQLE